jgi:hypothetical protein
LRISSAMKLSTIISFLNPLHLDILLNLTIQWIALTMIPSQVTPALRSSWSLVAQPILLLKCSMTSHLLSYSFYQPVKSSFILLIYAFWEIILTTHWSSELQIHWCILRNQMVGIIILRKELVFSWPVCCISTIWWKYLIQFFIIFVKFQPRNFCLSKCN